ncbi:MAG: riboflavin synthase [Pseudanabaena sp.]|jgi:riboflavin synthase|nr:riboflavin synthase [Pseudanabaena sp. M090S1SP2A07QC]MCA6505840.1 riboflavin synthase [Pseudanabaena sp. M172S2SP2A07QC]MCA6521542.1 riboflavin synthase [Pseudanabaena sp. M051S1SP2A07QC]MCA6525317.1 riboflavin synthase [Pseudanabaena sp. M179S2SP2A07QC]MCA6528434.1 riboflavin synthase [Pseudanabaena sp. M125S2SP2A07QC]MCA6533717.1 riboflavin synthase [Pseudanabaena sp. M176S2SP2A07QC]MCA6539396.1 riboflavin synthase [Pseudanabaena sp. M037S2SP2A07QC]MCA6542576.1 riboflavin synthase [Pse
MFTGLVQSIGIIEKRDRDRLVIHCPDLVANIAIGDSVAVNGVCLTATYISDTNFVADVSPETLGRTNFGDRKLKYVNLETALAVGDKIGGHFVSGHIDGMGKLSDRVLIGNSWELGFDAIPDVARYIVFKGSIAINGISLTISYCNDSGTNFRVAVIPHTYENTTLKDLDIGSSVHLEGDLLGKYVEKFLRLGNPLQNNPSDPPKTLVTPAFLAEHGW